MKWFEILQELSKCDRDMKWVNAIGKMMPMYLPDSVAINVQFGFFFFFKALSEKHSKTGVPVF